MGGSDVVILFLCQKPMFGFLLLPVSEVKQDDGTSEAATGVGKEIKLGSKLWRWPQASEYPCSVFAIGGIRSESGFVRVERRLAKSGNGDGLMLL